MKRLVILSVLALLGLICGGLAAPAFADSSTTSTTCPSDTSPYMKDDGSTGCLSHGSDVQCPSYTTKVTYEDGRGQCITSGGGGSPQTTTTARPVPNVTHIDCTYGYHAEPQGVPWQKQHCQRNVSAAPATPPPPTVTVPVTTTSTSTSIVVAQPSAARSLQGEPITRVKPKNSVSLAWIASALLAAVIISGGIFGRRFHRWWHR